MSPPLKKNFKIFIILNSVLILYAIAYSLYFNLTLGTEKEIVCVIKNTFGIYCPGCGGSRSLSAFLRLDFIKSFILYPAIPISAFLVFGYDVRLLLSLFKKNTKYTDGYKFYEFILIPIVIILTFIVRNVLLLIFKTDVIGDIIPRV